MLLGVEGFPTKNIYFKFLVTKKKMNKISPEIDKCLEHGTWMIKKHKEVVPPRYLTLIKICSFRNIIN